MKCKLLVLMLMTLATTVNLQAQSECGKSHGFYVGGMTGLNVQIFEMSSSKVKTYPGIAAAGALGYKFRNGLRVEGEYSYRRNEIRRVQDFSVGNLNAKGHADTQAYVMNLLYDIDLYRGWTPYFGVGVGYAQLTSYINSNQFGKQKIHTKGVATQYIGGITHRVIYNTDLGLEFRYFRSRQHAQDYTVALSMRRFF